MIQLDDASSIKEVRISQELITWHYYYTISHYFAAVPRIFKEVEP